MDSDGMEIVRRYVKRAEETRIIAAGMCDKDNREKLLQVAEEWEIMARHMARIVLRPVLERKGVRF